MLSLTEATKEAMDVEGVHEGRHLEGTDIS